MQTLEFEPESFKNIMCETQHGLKPSLLTHNVSQFSNLFSPLLYLQPPIRNARPCAECFYWLKYLIFLMLSLYTYRMQMWNILPISFHSIRNSCLIFCQVLYSDAAFHPSGQTQKRIEKKNAPSIQLIKPIFSDCIHNI